MTTMAVTKIPLVLQGDFDPIRLSVDNLIKYILLYMLSCFAQKNLFFCFGLPTTYFRVHIYYHRRI